MRQRGTSSVEMVYKKARWLVLVWSLPVENFVESPQIVTRGRHKKVLNGKLMIPINIQMPNKRSFIIKY